MSHETTDPHSAQAVEAHFSGLDKAEVQAARAMTPDAIRDNHADLLEAQADEPGVSPEEHAELTDKARIARKDAQDIREGRVPTTPVPPTFG